MGTKHNPPIHPETIRMAEYVRAITSAGSVRSVDVEFMSPVQCRERRNNRRCKGKIKITPRADVIEYSCTDCGVSGIMTDWRGCDCDLSEFAVTSIDADVLTLHVSEDEYKALQEVRMLSYEEGAMIAGAVWTRDGVVLTGSCEALDELAGNVAFEANHSPGAKRHMVLDGLCEKIERVVEG